MYRCTRLCALTCEWLFSRICPFEFRIIRNVTCTLRILLYLYICLSVHGYIFFTIAVVGGWWRRGRRWVVGKGGSRGYGGLGERRRQSQCIGWLVAGRGDGASKPFLCSHCLLRCLFLENELIYRCSRMDRWFLRGLHCDSLAGNSMYGSGRTDA